MAKQQPERRFTLLYDKVCRQDILQEAWQRVKSNKGAAGVDQVDIDAIRDYGEERFLSELEQELRSRQLSDCVGAPGSHTEARTAGEDSAVGHPDGQRELHLSPVRIWDGRRSVIRSIRCAASASKYSRNDA